MSDRVRLEMHPGSPRYILDLPVSSFNLGCTVKIDISGPNHDSVEHAHSPVCARASTRAMTISIQPHHRTESTPGPPSSEDRCHLPLSPPVKTTPPSPRGPAQQSHQGTLTAPRGRLGPEMCLPSKNSHTSSRGSRSSSRGSRSSSRGSRASSRGSRASSRGSRALSQASRPLSRESRALSHEPEPSTINPTQPASSQLPSAVESFLNWSPVPPSQVPLWAAEDTQKFSGSPPAPRSTRPQNRSSPGAHSSAADTESDDDPIFNAWGLGFMDGRQHERAEMRRLTGCAVQGGGDMTRVPSSGDTTLVEGSQPTYVPIPSAQVGCHLTPKMRKRISPA